MTDLDDALDAFRTTYERTSDRGARTRTRVLQSAHRRAVLRPWKMGSAIAMALVATNATTWAWASGALSGVGYEEPAQLVKVGAPDVEHPVRAPEHETIAAPATLPHAPPVATPSPRRSIRPAPAAVMDVAEQTPSDGLSEALAELEPIAPASTEDPDRRAFDAAHQSHFGGAAPVEALAAWDRYLGQFPAGRFAPEARFNRAVCLLRLGRLGEAREILAVFAAGDVSGLRRAEARRLLEAIDSGRIRRP